MGKQEDPEEYLLKGLKQYINISENISGKKITKIQKISLNKNSYGFNISIIESFGFENKYLQKLDRF